MSSASLLRKASLFVCALPVHAFAQAPFDVNLIVNPGAEAGASSGGGQTGVDVPGWSLTNMLTVASYGSAGLPSATSPGSPSRGSQFFIGGPAVNQTPMASQTIDLTGGILQIDQGRVQFTLRAWLGGVAGQDDTALIAVLFNNAAGESVGTGNILGPTNAGRGGVTGMLSRTRVGEVPAGARSATIILSMSRVQSGLNEGCADDVSLVLEVGPCPSDWNLDEGVDGDDVINFFENWDVGNADFNDDGGTDGDDVIGFFERWDLGC